MKNVDLHPEWLFPSYRQFECSAGALHAASFLLLAASFLFAPFPRFAAEVHRYQPAAKMFS